MDDLQAISGKISTILQKSVTNLIGLISTINNLCGGVIRPDSTQSRRRQVTVGTTTSTSVSASNASLLNLLSALQNLCEKSTVSVSSTVLFREYLIH
jgi:hypothetical protein